MGIDQFDSLRQKLELEQWPAVYMYKFIFKGDNRKMALIESEFSPEAEISINTSSTGRYVSITVKEEEASADAVIEKYNAISKIEGVMIL